MSELILAYWTHAQAYYRLPDGSPTTEQEGVKSALRALRKLYGSTAASDFGPVALKAVRRSMIDAGLARSTINARVGKIVRAFKWAVENELVHASSHHALQAVAGLRKGRTEAREPEPVRPVAADAIAAIESFVARQVWAMVRLQLLTGMRSGEVMAMCSGDVDRSAEVWVYTPQGHKLHFPRLRSISRWFGSRRACSRY